jgi:hypothetical protein
MEKKEKTEKVVGELLIPSVEETKWAELIAVLASLIRTYAEGKSTTK